MRLIRHLCLLLVLISISAEPTVSNSCQRNCGKISIPFPFGIGHGCYHNDWYEVKCNNFVPFLPKINKEVVQIDLPRPLKHEDNLVEYVPFGSLRIKTNVNSIGCNSGSSGERPEELVNLTGTPFRISGNHMLVAFGCNNKVTLTHVEPRIVGCISTCNFTHIFENFPPFTPLTTGCYGYKCCNVSTPTESSDKIGVKIESIDGNITSGGCRVAFITDQFNQPSRPWVNITDPKWFHEKKYSTIQLKWKVLTMNMSFEKSLQCLTDPLYDVHSRPCYCSGVISIRPFKEKINYLRCACTYGFEGNPYEVDGCKDVNECTLREAGSPKYCPTRGETCLNVPGSYRCVIKEDKSYQIYIGVGVGSGVLLIGAAFWLYKLIKKHIKRNLREKCFRRNGGMLLQQQLSSREDSVENTMVFTSKELEKATEGFSLGRVLGRGGQGTVFKGMLTDGRIVAVKKSTVLDEDRVGEFINELLILSQLNHRNIVKVLGCCLETEVPLLVYEFISNGNLFQRLQEESADQVLTWEVRVGIAKDVARGLSYLHSVASPPVFHKDIKSANIMIDENFRGKLADFGTSRVIAGDHMSHMTSVVSGTPGYVDPQYQQSGRYTEKSDAYSYGVVLAELITGRRPYFQGNSTLASFFLHAMKEKRLLDILDPRIRNDCDLEQVMVMANIASSCLNLEGEKRPTMILISLELEHTFSSLPDTKTTGNDKEEVAEASGRSREPLSIDVASTSTSLYELS
ncbi:hypothetical protein HID58_030611 [Brassica napus]|uniref:(rape) hypothetical protein n=1 Tax=Brassica napus TaxID=3708 RepID=A0A817A5Y6_BRANA|nr:wall-associated receptor kinase-like 17 [Brassica napus]KAH0916165.1 hypothetical protein HID58_030611 [Brassica napus]CAF2255747.1 unnamed protein product [Brassica napus]